MSSRDRDQLVGGLLLLVVAAAAALMLMKWAAITAAILAVPYAVWWLLDRRRRRTREAAEAEQMRRDWGIAVHYDLLAERDEALGMPGSAAMWRGEQERQDAEDRARAYRIRDDIARREAERAARGERPPPAPGSGR